MAGLVYDVVTSHDTGRTDPLQDGRDHLSCRHFHIRILGVLRDGNIFRRVFTPLKSSLHASSIVS